MDLLAAIFQQDRAFSASTGSAANGVKDYSRPSGRLKYGRTSVDRYGSIVRFENNTIMFHCSIRSATNLN